MERHRSSNFNLFILFEGDFGGSDEGGFRGDGVREPGVFF
jgi:hypothetical protein